MTSVKFWMHTVSAQSSTCLFAFPSSSSLPWFRFHLPGVSYADAQCLLSFHSWRGFLESEGFILCSVFILLLRIKDFSFSLPTVGKRNDILLKFSRCKFSRKKATRSYYKHIGPAFLGLSSQWAPELYVRPGSLHFKGKGAKYPACTKVGGDGGNVESLK